MLGLLRTRPFFYDAMEQAVCANLGTISRSMYGRGHKKRNTLHKVAEPMKAGHP